MHKSNRSRRALWCVLVVAALVGAAAVPASADDSEPAPFVGPQSRIIGGTESLPGAWPSQVGLLQRDVANNFQAQFCGGTAVNKSWVLTAAHCVVGQSASDIDVLGETQSLTSGGRRVHAKEIRILSGYDADTFYNDLALIRLDTPLNAPGMPYIGQNQSIGLGTNLTVTGWGCSSVAWNGDFYECANSYPSALRQVTVPTISDASCQDSYEAATGGQITTYPQVQFCAGFLGVDGKDSCQGDSGGPISRWTGSKWEQVGIVSWGIGCANGEFPGVYTRLSKFSNHVSNNIRYGPQPDAVSFVNRQYVDFIGRQATSSEKFYGVNALATTSNSTWVRSTFVQGATWQSRAGGTQRLYQAFFQRDADTNGMKYWIGRLQSGSASLRTAARLFADSTEFDNTYGALTNTQFVQLVYNNVLDRAPDAAGLAYWVNQLNSGTLGRGDVMLGFSESSEFRNKTKTRTDVVITFFGLLRRVPNSGEFTTWLPQSNLTLVSTLLGSFSYAARF